MRARLVPLGADIDPALHSALALLATSALEPNPFFGPGALGAAVAAFDAEGVGLLVVERADGRLAAALPVQRVSGFAHLRLAALRTWRHDYRFLGTPLVDREDPVTTLAALVDWVRREVPAPWLVLDGLRADGPVTASLLAALHGAGCRPTPFAAEQRAALYRRAEPTYLEQTVRGAHGKDLRRLRRVLSREFGAQISTVDRAGEPAAVEEFLALETAGWKGRSGSAMARRPGHDEFFRRLCTDARTRGALQLLALGVDGRAVAMKCNLVQGDMVFCFKIAFDERYARCSPGVLLEIDNVERFHRSDAAWMDSCASPDNRMINRLWPDRTALTTLLVPLSRRGAVAARVAATARVATARRRG